MKNYVSKNCARAVGNYWEELEAYVIEGGRLILSTFDVDGSHSESTTLWSTLGAEWISDMSSPEPVYRWTPTHSIFTTPNEISDLTSYYDGYFDNGDHIRATTGTAVAGFTSTPSENFAAIVLGESARTLLISFLLSEFRYDEDADGKLDAVELWENAITYICARAILCVYSDSRISVPSHCGKHCIQHFSQSQLNNIKLRL